MQDRALRLSIGVGAANTCSSALLCRQPWQLSYVLVVLVLLATILYFVMVLLRMAMPYLGLCRSSLAA